MKVKAWHTAWLVALCFAPAGLGAFAVRAADFNGDGKPDLAVANTSDRAPFSRTIFDCDWSYLCAWKR